MLTTISVLFWHICEYRWNRWWEPVSQAICSAQHSKTSVRGGRETVVFGSFYRYPLHIYLTSGRYLVTSFAYLLMRLVTSEVD
jgi:hypothetical protein